jgi:prepilin-type N-terminal cleavage/methylation domain-containing protein
MARGFTMIEIIVVVIIIAVLAALIGPRFFGEVGKAKSAVAQQKLKVIEQAVEKFYYEHNRFPANLDELVDVAGKGFDFLVDVPGYRSHSVLRGKAMRGKFAQPVLGSFAVRYSQWDDKESYDAFRLQAEAEQSAERRSSQAQLDSLTTSLEWNTYRVFHSRSADQPTALSA